jgi:CheY-like chemotaxis protein
MLSKENSIAGNPPRAGDAPFLGRIPAITGLPEPEDAPNPAHRAKPARVLVMDDDDIVRLTFEAILDDLACETEFALHGAEALDKYAKAIQLRRRFDLVILDLIIPGRMGGCETMRQLLRLDPHACAVATSGNSDDRVITHYWEFGFRGVLPKPFAIEEMSKLLERFVCRPE